VPLRGFSRQKNSLVARSALYKVPLQVTRLNFASVSASLRLSGFATRDQPGISFSQLGEGREDLALLPSSVFSRGLDRGFVAGSSGSAGQWRMRIPYVLAAAWAEALFLRYLDFPLATTRESATDERVSCITISCRIGNRGDNETKAITRRWYQDAISSCGRITATGDIGARHIHRTNAGRINRIGTDLIKNIATA
jgi:hypothetical protein